MNAFGSAAEALIHAVFDCFFVFDLRPPRNNNKLIPHPFFDGIVVEFFHVFIMDIVMGDDGRNQNGIGIMFHRRIHHFLDRNGSTQVFAADAVLFDSPVFDVDDFAKANGMFVFPDGTATTLNG